MSRGILLMPRFGFPMKSSFSSFSSPRFSSRAAAASLPSRHRGAIFVSTSRCLLSWNVNKSNNGRCGIVSSAKLSQNQHGQVFSHFASNDFFSSCRNFHNGRKTQRFNIKKDFALPPQSHHTTSFELVEKSSGSSLIVRKGDTDSGQYPMIWLRDHCRCPSCYNHTTHQKDNVHSNLYDPQSGRIEVTNILLQNGGNTLVVHWKDGHKSQFSVDWLLSHSTTAIASSVRKFLWTGDTVGSPLPVPYQSHVETEEGLRQTLLNLLEYGFALISEAPASQEGTKKATDRVAPIQETFFGGLWQFTADGSFSDTAYGSGYLAAHTDNTYLEMPAGIQVFQCLGHDGRGGETLLVDGFHAVEVLRKKHPRALRCLTTHMIPHEYKETASSSEGGSPGYHMYTMCPVIRLHPVTGEALHLRFNPYDRAPLNTIPTEDMLEFYNSYHLLSEVIADPQGEFWVKLNPGTILLVDNWRVLHGRAAFDGKRVMCGCYLRRDDWMSKVRIMGLMNGRQCILGHNEV